MAKSFFGAPDSRAGSKSGSDSKSGSLSGNPLKGVGKDSRCHSGDHKVPNLGQGSKKDLGSSGSVDSSSMGMKKGPY